MKRKFKGKVRKKNGKMWKRVKRGEKAMLSVESKQSSWIFFGLSENSYCQQFKERVHEFS